MGQWVTLPPLSEQVSVSLGPQLELGSAHNPLWLIPTGLELDLCYQS